MMDLTEFLLARIAEDKKRALIAKRRGDGHWASWNRSWDPGGARALAADGARIATLPDHIDEHVCAHDPKRVLDDCEAKRRIVDEHAAEAVGYSDRAGRCKRCAYGDHWEGYEQAEYPCDTLKALALPYADHEDYREEWKP